MSDVNKTAIFTLEIDNASFNREIVDATKKISELTHEKKLYIEKQKLGIQLTDEEIITLKKLDASIAANKKIVSDNTKILQKQTEATLAQTGSQKQLMAQYEAASLELKRLGGSFIKAKDGTLQLTGANKALEAETNAVFQKLKEYDAALGKHNLNVGNYGGVLTQLKQKIQELESQRSIVTDPDEVLRLTKEIRAAQFEYGKLTGKVDEMGNVIAKNDLKNSFNDANSAANALTGSISLLSVVMGDEGKTGEILQKVVVGITAAQTALSIAQNKHNVLSVVSAVKTKALAAAQWILNNSYKAFGIGAVITGLTILATKLFAVKTKTDDAKQSAEDYYAALKEGQEAWGKYADALTEANTELERNLEYAKLQGKSDIEILGLKRQIIQRQLEAIDLVNNENATFEKRFELDEKRKNLLLELDILDAEYIEDQKEKNELIAKQAWETRKLNTEISLLTEAQREQLNQTMFDAVVDSPDVKDAFQKLLGVDDKTFAEVWAQVGETAADVAPELKGVAENQAFINDLIDKENAKRKETLLLVEKQKQAAALLGDTIGNVFSGMLATAEEQQKEFYKSALLGLLDYLERFLTAKIAEVFISQVASKGFAGIVTAGVLTGLMKASFNVVRNSISGFAEGGVIEDSHGVPIQRSNGDNRLVTVKTGEVILNERQQSDLKAGVGADIFRRLRVPGFATGGLVLGDGGMTSRAMISKATQGIELRQAIMDAMSVMPRPIVEVTEITTLQAKVNRAEAVASI